MTTKDEALKMALNALEFSKSYLDDLADVHGTSKKAKPGSTSWHVDRAITACREALAQKDKQEPALWKWILRSDPGHFGYYTEHPSKFGIDMSSEKYEWTLFYTAPPKRKPLTDERDSEDDLRAIILRREAVIKVLERDAHEAHQRASNAIGARKVLWNLLGECSPLLHQLECDDAESEDRLNSLLQRIDDARSVVQAEELPGTAHASS